MRRPAPEINASSMADIAFLLLIFFLVTTKMDVDSGITRIMPPLPEADTPVPEVKQRNVFIIDVNYNDQLTAEGKPISIGALKQQVKEFIENPAGDPELSENENLSEKIKKTTNSELRGKYEAAYKLLGDKPVSKGIILLQNNRGTSYLMYIKVQNELANAYNELRNELSEASFGISFDKLIEQKLDAKAEAVKIVVPMQISETESKSEGGK